MGNFFIDYDHDFWVKNWRIYEENLKRKRSNSKQFLSFTEMEEFLKAHPELIVEFLDFLSHTLKIRVAENPYDTITVNYRPQNENGSYLLKDGVSFDLIEAVGIITQQMAKQYNYAGRNCSPVKFF